MDTKRENDDRFSRGEARGRVIAALVLIAVGLLFLMANMGFASIDRVGAAVGNAAGNFGEAIGEFFGRFGQAVGEFFGNFGEVIGSFFGSFAANFSRLWPLLLIIVGLALIVRRPGDGRKSKAKNEA